MARNHFRASRRADATRFENDAALILVRLHRVVHFGSGEETFQLNGICEAFGHEDQAGFDALEIIGFFFHVDFLRRLSSNHNYIRR
jgi:hypothetical protein